MFLVDIFINLNMSYFSSDGEEIIDRRHIIWNYLKGSFIIDFLSTFPFEYITEVSHLCLII